MINSVLKNNHLQLQETWPICELFSSKVNYYTSMEKNTNISNSIWQNYIKSFLLQMS